MKIFRKEKASTEQEVLKKQIELAEEQISELRRLRRKERLDKTREKLGWVLKNITPRGIRHPDSLVGNLHLYIPGRRGRTKIR